MFKIIITVAIVIATILVAIFRHFKNQPQVEILEQEAAEAEEINTLHESATTEITASMVAMETKPAIIVGNEEMEVAAPETTIPMKPKAKPVNKGKKPQPKAKPNKKKAPQKKSN
jgi:hypothetical protein